MPALEHAIALAADAHAGQLDKGGQLYFLHPLRVMMAVEGDLARMVAVLHDVVEDTDVSLDELRFRGYPIEVVDAVDCLTKRPGESRMDAAIRVASNHIAVVVKLADIEDNMDTTRLKAFTEKDAARMVEYHNVRRYLLNL